MFIHKKIPLICSKGEAGAEFYGGKNAISVHTQSTARIFFNWICVFTSSQNLSSISHHHSFIHNNEFFICVSIEIRTGSNHFFSIVSLSSCSIVYIVYDHCSYIVGLSQPPFTWKCSDKKKERQETLCLGLSYYVNFLGGLGSNEFHIEWRFGTNGSWKNQNPDGRFGATS